MDTPTFLNRTVGTVAPGVALDSYQYTGTCHGVIHSHLDAVDCHIMVDGRGYGPWPNATGFAGYHIDVADSSRTGVCHSSAQTARTTSHRRGAQG